VTNRRGLSAESPRNKTKV